jgi:hypothetical protein
MSLGTNETVASLHLRILWVDVHRLKVKYRERFNNGQTAADMTDTEMPDACHDIAAYVFANFFKIVAQTITSPQKCFIDMYIN